MEGPADFFIFVFIFLPVYLFLKMYYLQNVEQSVLLGKLVWPPEHQRTVCLVLSSSASATMFRMVKFFTRVATNVYITGTKVMRFKQNLDLFGFFVDAINFPPMNEFFLIGKIQINLGYRFWYQLWHRIDQHLWKVLLAYASVPEKKINKPPKMLF